MKRFVGSKLVILVVGLLGFCLYLSSQPIVNKQYVEVTLKSGETVRFEYRPFMEANLSILPEKKPDSPNEVKWFGGRRVIFVGKDTCEKYNIGLDNIREVEVLGMDFNPCNQKKDWLFKLKLLALDKYIGFFQAGESNIGKTLAGQGVKGQLLDKPETVTLQYEDIQKITFFPM